MQLTLTVKAILAIIMLSASLQRKVTSVNAPEASLVSIVNVSIERRFVSRFCF